MPTKNKAVDAYINGAAAFAKPILMHIRKLVHQTCPEVEEKIKWGFPHFDYKGAMMCSMAAFKQHAVMGFWKASLMKDAALLETARSEVSMGHLGRLISIKDLPADKKLTGYIREAMVLNETGQKVAKKEKQTTTNVLDIPVYFSTALKKDKKAFETFQAFSNSQKKEYVDWVHSSKTETTRLKRLATAIEWMGLGKRRNWKYEKK